jgi:hypothetical protein
MTWNKIQSGSSGSSTSAMLIRFFVCWKKMGGFYIPEVIGELKEVMD